MHLNLPTRPVKHSGSTFRHALLLLITLLVVSGTITAQETDKAQEDSVLRLMTEGMQLVAEGSPDSLTKAITKFESARTVMHSLKNSLGEGLMLSMIGHAYTQLDQNRKAKEKYLESLPLFREAKSPQA